MISVYDEDKLLNGEIDTDVLEEIWFQSNEALPKDR